MAYFSRRLLRGNARLISGRMVAVQGNLRKAGLFLPADAYVSFMLLMSGVVFLMVFLNAFVVGWVISGSTLFAGVIGFAGGLTGAIVAFAFTYIYPSVLAGKKRKLVDEGLPFALSFMSILSAAGVAPKQIFKSLARLEEEGQVGLGGEARTIYRDLELLGGDMVSVLRDVAARKISPLFSAVLDGMISTIRSGGDLTTFLGEEGRSLMKMRQSLIKSFLDTLVMISEMYMALMVAFPLILIVMLVVMSSIGGGSIGASSPETIVPLIIYGMVPVVGIFVLWFLDNAAPRG